MENYSRGNEGWKRAAGDLSELRRFPGAPKDFWPRLVTSIARLSGTDSLVLLLGKPNQSPRWVKIGENSKTETTASIRVELAAQLEKAADRCLSDGSYCAVFGNGMLIAIRLKLLVATDEVILVGVIADGDEAMAQEALVRLNLAADTPELYQRNLATRQAQEDVEKFAVVLEWMTLINGETHFIAAGMTLCNSVASHFRCERVSLGWIESGYIQLKVISRTEKFDRQMEAAQGLEIAMEECLDQDEEIIWPLIDGANSVTRDHEKFAKDQSSGNLCSIPLRVGGTSVAVLTCERQEQVFTPVELQQLRLCCDQVVMRLNDLKRADCWFGARWKNAIREKSAEWMGPEYTWIKLSALLIALLFAVLFFWKVNYRVEGNFILRSDEVAYLTAPFDGYIEKVPVRAGDHLQKGGELLALNRSELFLEESAAVADLSRYQREAEKARATKALAEMRISESQSEQAQARLDLIRYRLQSAVIISPFDGVVVEGDLRERIAAPVKQGDALFKVARTDTLYAEAEVNERDVKEILGSHKAEIAFVTQPKSAYPVSIVVIEPAAAPKKEGNIFLVRLRFDRGPESWWRPGMTGICKIGGEKKTLFWILTHRTVDFLRLKLWW